MYILQQHSILSVRCLPWHVLMLHTCTVTRNLFAHRPQVCVAQMTRLWKLSPATTSHTRRQISNSMLRHTTYIRTTTDMYTHEQDIHFYNLWNERFLQFYGCTLVFFANLCYGFFLGEWMQQSHIVAYVMFTHVAKLQYILWVSLCGIALLTNVYAFVIVVICTYTTLFHDLCWPCECVDVSYCSHVVSLGQLSHS